MKYNDNGLWKTLNVKVTDTLPVGTIIPYAGSTIPSNYMKCEGQELSRIEYDLLFNAIGTTYGVGDGTTTFNLPNLKGRVITGIDINDTDFDTLGETGGEKTHTLTIDEMPSHNHGIRDTLDMNTVAGDNRSVVVGGGATWNPADPVMLSDTGGDQPHNIMQPYIVLNYIIKVLDAPATGVRSETLPVGSEIDYDGTNIPVGWEEITAEQILWTNSAPSEDFAYQTITLSSSDYDILGIYYYDYKVSKNMQYTQCLKGASFTLNSQLFVSSNYFIVSRVFSRTSDTIFTVDNAVGISASSPSMTTLHNDQIIPVYIVGYKTDLFN